MIKKTIKTIWKNPLILTIAAMPFISNIIKTYLLSPVTFKEAIDNYAVGIEPLVYISWAVKGILAVGWAVFVLPPILLYIYRAVDKKTKKGWYSYAIDWYWWRAIAIYLITALFALAVCIVLGVLYRFILIIRSHIMVYLFAGLTIFLIAAILVFTAIGTSAVFAEQYFMDGLKNVFNAGAKYFFRILPAIILLTAPLIVLSITEVGETEIYSIVSLLYAGLINTFMYVYSMNCYVEWKNGRPAADTDSMDAQDGMVQPDTNAYIEGQGK